MYKITLSDGTIIECQGLNGNNYISRTELTPAMFEGKLSRVTIDGPHWHEEHGPMKLIQIQKYGEEWWLILGDLTHQEILNHALTKGQEDMAAAMRAVMRIIAKLPGGGVNG